MLALLLAPLCSCGFLASECGTSIVGADATLAEDGGPAPDAAGLDGAARDRGSVSDAASADSSRAEAAIADGASPDASGGDAWRPDILSVDAGFDEAGLADALRVDAVVTDVALADALVADAGGSDALVADAGLADAGLDDAGLAAGPCGTTGVYVDNFDDDVLGVLWEPYSLGSSVALERNQRIEIELRQNSYANVFTRYPVSIIGDSISIELSQAVTAAQESSAYLSFWLDDARQITVQQIGPSLTVNIRDPNDGWGGNHSFDPVAMRWWKIREAGGLLTFSTSPDGALWSDLGSAPTPAFARRGQISIGGGTWAGGDRGLAAFDNLNSGRQSVPWCPIQRLSDGFDDGEIDLLWDAPSGPGCSAEETGGILHLTAAPGHDCYLYSASLYRLDDSSITVDIAGGAYGVPGSFVGLLLFGPLDGFYIYFGIEDGALVAAIDEAGYYQTLSEGDYSRLRVSKSGAVILMEAWRSSGGWVELPLAYFAGQLNPLIVGINADCQRCGGGPGVLARFDGVNVAP